MRNVPKLALSVSALLLAASFTPPAIASSIEGKSCKSSSETKVSGNYTYTCNKVGSKLKWVKTSFQANIPISLPVAQTAAITFSNAVEKYADIPEVAYNSIQSTLSNNASVSIPTTLRIGTHTNTTSSYLKSLLRKEYQLWRGFRQAPSFTALVYNAQDESWAETEWPKLARTLSRGIPAAAYIPNHLRAGCGFDINSTPRATECWGGMALSFSQTNAGFAFFGVQNGDFWMEASSEKGPVSQVTHEYAHITQFSQWIGSMADTSSANLAALSHTFAPCWFTEGQANAIGIPLASTNLSSYQSGRENSIRRNIDLSRNPSLTTLGASEITNFLYQQNPATCYHPESSGDYQLGYNVGYAAVEALIAIGGPQATMAVMAEGASGMNWSTAFQTVYGLSWSDATVVLGQVLAAEYAAKPMNH